jgi:hypothetical protein
MERVADAGWVKRARPLFLRVATRVAAPRIEAVAKAAKRRKTKGSREKEDQADLVKAITGLAQTVAAMPA